MNSNREGSTMSNEKMAATGMALHWPVGFTKTACGGSQGPDAPTVLRRADVTCGNCILKLAVFDMATRRQASETTGEHVWNKLQDDLYADFEPAKAVPEFPWTSQFQVGDQITAGQRARWVSEDPEGYFAWVKLEAAEAARAAILPTPNRGWTPTPGEIGLALGIVVAIIVIFCFIVVAY